MRLTGVRIGGWCRDITPFVAAGLLLAGCGSASRTLRADTLPVAVARPPAGSPGPTPLVNAEPTPTVEAAGESTVVLDVGPSSVGAEPVPTLAAQAPASPGAAETNSEVEQYDPWEPFNETMFDVNLRLDKYVLKPAARVYRVIIPEPFQIVIANGFDNIRWPGRFINSLLQGKFGGAGREVVRFLINSTAGVGGLFDPAKDYWGIRPSKEDFGQTLGVWGSWPGPYLILPFLEPMTVRDGVGRAVDGVTDPLSWFLPFIWDRLAMKAGDTVNERALNYELFQGVEETTIDLYSSVRHFYLQRRDKQIKE